jgi:hypothetical protein
MASTLWQLGNALELWNKDSEELQKGHFALFVLKGE